jgi:ubiquinone/menaquinone biosynthesis C-methylase UbiE
MSGATERDERERSQRRVRKFYQISSQREWKRLEDPLQGALEFAVHKAWIAKFLPPAGAHILDIGGGPGRYSIWLAEQGYRVTLADLSPDLLAIAREKSAEAGVGLEAAVEADARDLAQFADDAFDAVLCLGPFYHLKNESDRRAVADEVFRVIKPGGPIFAAFLNRLQVLRVAIDQDIPFFTPYTFEMVKQWHDEGFLVMPVAGIFTDAYSVHPRDVKPFMEISGFQTADLISSQSIAADRMKHLALFAERQPTLYPWVMDRLVEVANEPSTLGSGFHILYIGRKP